MAEVLSPTAYALTGSFEVTRQLTSMLHPVKSLQEGNIDSSRLNTFACSFFCMFLVYNLFTLFNRVPGMIIKLFSSVETANLAVHFISRERLLRGFFRSKWPWKQGYNWIFNYNSCRCTFYIVSGVDQSQPLSLFFLKCWIPKLLVDCRRFVYKNKNIRRKVYSKKLSAFFVVCTFHWKKLTEMKINWLKNSKLMFKSIRIKSILLQN